LGFIAILAAPVWCKTQRRFEIKMGAMYTAFFDDKHRQTVAPKGRDIPAQGNALGMGANPPEPALKGRDIEGIVTPFQGSYRFLCPESQGVALS